MKRNFTFLKTLLVAVGLLGGVNAWATTTVLYGRAVTADLENGYTAWSSADIYDGENGDWTGSTTFASITGGLNIQNNSNSNASQVITNSSITAPQANSTLTYDIVWDNGFSLNHNDHYTYLSVGSGIQFRAYGQAQKGEIIIGSTTINVPNACNDKNGNRSNDVWTIHMVVNTNSNTVTALTIQGSLGTTKVNYTLDEAKSIGTATYTSLSLGWNRANYRPAFTTTLQSVKITEETSSATYADYTVHFVDGDGATVKDDEVRNGEVGTTVNANSTDKEDYYSGNYKYVYVNDGNGVEVLNDGSAELTVTYSKYTKYNYTVNAIDAGENILAELATGYIYTDANTATTSLPWYVLYNGTLYYQNQNSNTTSITSNNQVINITYASNSSNVVYYTEGENISGGIWIASNNNSNKAAARALSNAKITTLQPGKYQIYSRFIVGNGKSGETYCTNPFTVGATALEYDVPAKTTTNYTSEEFTVTESTDLYVTFAGSSISGVDYVYIKRTAVPATITSAGWATFASAYDLDFTTPISGLTAYKATSATENAITLEEVDGKVKAGNGLVLKGAAGTYYVPVTTGASTIYSTPATISMWGNTGSTNETVSKAGSGTNFVLALQDENVVFAPIKDVDATLNPGQAALWANVTIPDNARALNIVFGDETNGVEAIESNVVKTNNYYNLNGQRVVKPSKGLYIVNGKKVIVK